MDGKTDKSVQDQNSRLELLHGRAVVVFSIIASIWAGLTGGLDYWRDYLAQEDAKRQTQATAVADISRVVGVMRFNCDKSFGALVTLGDRADTSQKKVCYQAFVDLSSLIYGAAIKIERPPYLSEEIWRARWASFSEALTDVGGNDYVASQLDCPWSRIAQSKNAVLLEESTCEGGT